MAASGFAAHLVRCFPMICRFWQDRPRFVNSRRFKLALDPVKHLIFRRLSGAWFSVQSRGSMFTPAALSGSSRTLFAANGLPASAAIDVLQRGRPICPPQHRRKRTADPSNLAICGEPGKKAVVETKIHELCRHFSGVLYVRSNELWDMSVEGIR